MRKLLLFIVISFISSAGFPQQPAELFERAYNLYTNDQPDSALLLFEKIYHIGVSDESLIAKARFNTGSIYFGKKNYSRAKKIFTDILEADYDEMDSGGMGTGLGADPYTLYKNHSCKLLAEIALIEKDYSGALHFTWLADKVFPFKHFCGNAHASNHIYLTWTYARCYAGQGDTSKAIRTLLPECFENPLAGNDEVVELAVSLIKSKYCANEIHSQIEKAVEKACYIEESFNDLTYTTGSTQLFGITIKSFNDWYVMPKTKKEAELIQKLSREEILRYFMRKDKFYKLLSAEPEALFNVCANCPGISTEQKQLQ
jgi:tetratricopeptide (TPR) repeat protein